MRKKLSGKNRRLFVAVNYLCLLGFQIFFVLGENYNWPACHIILTILFLILLVFSFIQVYIGTGVWMFTKTDDENLDERQMQIRNHVLRNSYAAYGVISILVITYLKETSEPTSIFGAAPAGVPLVLFIGVLYVVNILPASMLAWQEKEV